MVLRLVRACLVAAGLAACGGGSSSHGSDRQRVANLLSSVDAAMARGDYTAACGYFSGHQQAAIVAAARRPGSSASTCASALSTLIKTTAMSRAQLARAFGGGGAPKVQSVATRGDQATVTYITSVAGHSYTETDGLVREDGQWKADRTIKRTRTG